MPKLFSVGRYAEALLLETRIIKYSLSARREVFYDITGKVRGAVSKSGVNWTQGKYTRARSCRETNLSL